MENLVQAVQDMRTQLEEARKTIAGLQGQLGNTQNELQQTRNALANPLVQMAQTASDDGPKLKKPTSYKGKGSIVSWIVHMDNYLAGVPENRAMSIAVSYLEGPAHEWYIGFKRTEGGALVTSWNLLKEALKQRFETLNKAKIARDKLSKWKQIKNVASFNDDFQQIILDNPGIGLDEQIDRYTRVLKPYFWKEMCTKEYTTLRDAMKDAERIESAHSTAGRLLKYTQEEKNDEKTDGPTPIDIGIIHGKKLTEAERSMCMKEGRCFICREKGHMVSNCPKVQGN